MSECHECYPNSIQFNANDDNADMCRIRLPLVLALIVGSFFFVRWVIVKDSVCLSRISFLLKETDQFRVKKSSSSMPGLSVVLH